MLLFCVFFEVMPIPMYLPDGAAVKFSPYNPFGGLIMLAAVIGCKGDRTVRFGHPTSADRAGVVAGRYGAIRRYQGVSRLTVHVRDQGPLSFHRWLPGTPSSSPPLATAVLMKVMDKVGLRHAALLPAAVSTRQRIRR